MTVTDLTKEDKEILLSGLSQLVYTFILIAMSISVCFVMAVYVIDASQDAFVLAYRDMLIIYGVCGVVLIYSFWVWIKFKEPLEDILSGKKQILSGVVNNKKINIKWGWHGSIPADFVLKPRLIEYIIEINQVPYFVEKTFYEAININDAVELNFTYPNNNFFLMKKIGLEV